MGKPSKCSFLSHCLSLATMKTWKLISIFVAIPGCLLCTYNAVLKEKEHHTHPRPEFLPYSHLRLRKKVGEEVFEIFPSYRISHIWWPYGKCTRIKWLRLVLCLGMLCCVLARWVSWLESRFTFTLQISKLPALMKAKGMQIPYRMMI